MTSPRAARIPAFTAAPFPMEIGLRRTRAPASRAASPVPSEEPSSITTIS